MQLLRFIFTITFASMLLIAAGCSKKESETTAAPSQSGEKTATAPTTPATPMPSEVTPAPAPAPAPAPSPSAAAQEETPAQLAAQVQQLESTYHNTPDFQKRVGLIYDLSSIESPATIDAIGRLFSVEPDPELKVELINSLSDIEGENDKKLAVLTSALRPDQPKDVRLEAIDAVAETEDKRGVQILQGLLQDADEDIRESAQDGIDQLQPK
jgi:type IV secretory pathway VirB10-like protein